MHEQMAATLDTVIERIRTIQHEARRGAPSRRPRWPMIVLETPKGWTGPKEVDGKKTEGFWRSHQVPLADVATREAHRRLLEQWMRSYQPEALFDESGRLVPRLAALAPTGPRRMGANPHANGGLLLKDLKMPAFRNFAGDVAKPATMFAEATRVLGAFLRDVM